MKNTKVKSLLHKLTPSFFKAPLLRSEYHIDSDFPKDLVFRKAQTYEEIQQAFKVAYLGYHGKGMVPDQPSEMQVTKFHALPTTTILIVKKQEKVIATASIILDSSMGLPLESCWSLTHLREDSVRLAEVTWLTVLAEGEERKQILLLFCKYIYEYCLKVLGVDTVVAAVPAGAKDLFELVFLFENIESGKPKKYDTYHGQKAVGQCLRISDVAQDVFRQVYGKKPKHADLFKFFCESECKNFQFPKQMNKSTLGTPYSPELFEYFFKSQSDILLKLTDKERNALSNLYFYSPYKSVIGISQTSAYRDRHQPRFMVLCRSRFCIRASGRMMTSTVLEVSRNGLKLRLTEPHQSYVGEEVSVSVELSPQNNVTLRGKVVWVLPGLQQLGIELENMVPERWQEFIDVLEAELKTRTGNSGKKPA